MLIIRNAQRVAFLGGLVEWIIDYLCASQEHKKLALRFMQGDDIDYPALRQHIGSICERGLAFGMEDSRLLFRLIMIALQADPAFLRQTSVADILNDRAASADSRLDALSILCQRSI